MNIRLYLPAALALGMLAGCGGDQAEAPPAETAQTPEPAVTQDPTPAAAVSAPPARAQLLNREGQEVGEVTFTQEGNEVVVAFTPIGPFGEAHTLITYA